MQKQNPIIPPVPPLPVEGKKSLATTIKEFAQDVVLPQAEKFFYYAAISLTMKECKLDKKSKEIVEEIKKTINENNFELPEEKDYLVGKLFINLAQTKEKIFLTKEFVMAISFYSDTDDMRAALCQMFIRNKSVPIDILEEVPIPLQAKHLLPVYIARGISSEYSVDEVLEEFFKDKNFKDQEPLDLLWALRYLAQVKNLPLDNSFLEEMSLIRKDLLEHSNELAKTNFPNLNPADVTSNHLHAFDRGLQEIIASGKIKADQGLGFLRKNYPSGHYARKGALLQILSSSELIKEYSISDLIKERTSLKDFSPLDTETLRPYLSDTWKKDTLKGCDQLYAEILIKKIIKPKEKEAFLQDVKMPILNLLTEIYLYNPKRFEEISQIDPKIIERLSRAVADKVLAQRKNFFMRNEIIFGDRADFLGAIHSDFEEKGLEELINRFSMRKKLIISGKEIDGENALNKDDFFASLKQLVTNTRNIGVIFLRNHGGPKHSWLAQGHLGAEKSELLEHPNAISYQELAKNIILAHEEKGLKKIDLKHIRLFLDECSPEEMAWYFYKPLVQSANEKEIVINSFPIIVTATQLGMNSFARLATPPNRSDLLEYIARIQLNVTRDFQAFHLLQVDKNSNEDLNKQNKDSVQDLQRYLNVYQVHAADPAIFDSKVISTEDLLKGLLPMLDINNTNYIDSADPKNTPLKFQGDEIRPLEVGAILNQSLNQIS